MSTLRIPSRVQLPVFLTDRGFHFRGILDFLLISIFWMYLLLGYGAMQIRIGPFPIGEAILLASLLFINHKSSFSKFILEAPALPLLAWWAIGFFHILWNMPEYGILAIRDGSHIIESLYIYIGFTFAGRISSIKHFSCWLPQMLYMALIYAATYPFRASLQSYSPLLSGLNSQAVPLLFTYTNTALVVLASTVYFIYKYNLSSQYKHLLLAGCALLIALVLFPSRTLILDLGCFIALIIPALRKMKLSKLIKAIIPLALILIVISCSDIGINGRFNEDFRLSDYSQIFLEIFGNQQGKHLTSGNELRYEWWASIIEKLMHSTSNFIFGLGYGMPLIDFADSNGSAIREPHNDLLGIFARGGIIGILSFILFQVKLASKKLELMKRLKPTSNIRPTSAFLFALIVFTLVGTIGESPFSMTFYTVPYYLSAGILLRIHRLLDKENFT